MAADRDPPRPASPAPAPARRLAGEPPDRHAAGHPPDRLPPEEESGTVVAFLGGSTRKGSWEPPALLRVLAFMGGVELDFREADLLEGETVLEILAFMGGVKIVVPPDVEVQAHGTGLLGGFQSASNHAPNADAPRLRITGLAVMGGVEVKVKKLPLKARLRGD